MSSHQEFQRCARLLKALAEPQRLRVLFMLFDGAKNVGQIAAALKESMQRVSYHLSVLRDAGFVTATKSGRFVDYALSRDVYTPNADAGAERVARLGAFYLRFPASGEAGSSPAR